MVSKDKHFMDSRIRIFQRGASTPNPYLINCSQKLHENEYIFPKGGGGGSLAVTLRSATGFTVCF